MSDLPSQLIKKIENNKIVIFAGAGTSMSAGLPSWKQLVIKILEGLNDKEPKSEKYKIALADEILTPIEVLTKIEYLREDAIDIFYNEIKAFSKVPPNAIHEKIGKLSDKIITTNYDELFERAIPNFETIPYTQKYKIAKLSEFEKYIFKIHGDINEPDNCILFPNEYNKLYSSEEQSSIFELKKIISDRSILFVGFSLEDPYINYIFENINTLYTGFTPEHFIITTQTNKKWPNRVTPLVIESFEKLEQKLDELIKAKTTLNQEVTEITDEIKQTNKNSIINIPQNVDFDSPPNNKFWVGRNKEIENIQNENFRVIFITGIGGQGKSALAAQYLRNYFNTDSYEFGDWRDFKEESNRFQTKIFSIIKRLDSSFDSANIDSLNNNATIDLFFHYLGNRKIVFVFDNVDSYIDLETFKPTGNLGYFFNQILEKNNNSKFIFTCRPFIREASVNFYQISLSGLSQSECEDLFNCYNIPLKKIQLKTLCERVHKLTKGHPLWLNLIAGQASRGFETVNDFVNKIENKTDFNEDKFSAILSEKILNEVWYSLNDKQKILIRSISETVKPEKEDNLKQILDSELNNNQFSKALRVLRNLNLVETLSEGEIELHPLVKEFILSKYPKKDRAKFITLLVQYYDTFIYILKPRLNLNSNLTIAEFQNWTSKIELQINKNDFSSALLSLEEIGNAILFSGYSEEYLRVSEMLYKSINWSDAINKEYSYFHTQFNLITSTQSQMGKFVECEKNLDLYVSNIQGKNQFYLHYCCQKAYNLWNQNRFSDAISCAEEGLFLLEESGLNDDYGIKHNLALALRDSKIKENIEKSLQLFLNNEILDNILNTNNLKYDLSGYFYGNIGKCLFLLNRQDDALYCYSISFKLLLKEKQSNSLLNIGYACSWFAEVLILKKNLIQALYFLKFGIICWENSSPNRTTSLKENWNNIRIDIDSKNYINNMSKWKIETECKKISQSFFTI